MKKQLYIIAYTIEGISLSIATFWTNEKAVRYVGELLSGEWDVKPDPDKDVVEYINDYFDYIREEEDNMCEIDVIVEVVEI